MAEKQVSLLLKESRPKANLVVRLGKTAISKFKQSHLPALSLSYLDPFQKTAVFSDFIDINNSAALKACAEWLLFFRRRRDNRDNAGCDTTSYSREVGKIRCHAVNRS